MRCPQGVAESVRVSQNARGDSVAAWVEKGCGASGRVLAVSRTAGHPWGRVRTMGRTSADDVEVALDARGGATLAWTRVEDGDYYGQEAAIVVASRSPGRSFRRPRVLDKHGARPVLAGNARGEEILAWKHLFLPVKSAHNGVMVAAIRGARTARFAHPQALSGPLAGTPIGSGAEESAVTDLQAAIAPDGAAVATWARASGSGSRAVEATMREPGGRFGSPLQVSDAVASGNLASSAAIADARDAIVAWTTNASDSQDGVFAARWNGQAFTAPTTLMSAQGQAPGALFFDLHALLSRRGTATLWWDDHTGCLAAGDYVIATLPLSGPSGAPRPATPPNTTTGSFAATLDRQDRVVKAWSTGRTIETDRYGNCRFESTELQWSINDGPTFAGPASGPRWFQTQAFAADPGPPTIIWQNHGRLLMMTLDQSGSTSTSTPTS